MPELQDIFNQFAEDYQRSHKLPSHMKSIVSYKRKDISELLYNPQDLERLSCEILFALDLARRAPSALNAQMWRFGFENDYNTMEVSMPRGYKHVKWEHPNVDVGICASHLWLGLLLKGLNPKVDICEDTGSVVFKFNIAECNTTLQ